jgi:hypothetical protein
VKVLHHNLQRFRMKTVETTRNASTWMCAKAMLIQGLFVFACLNPSFGFLIPSQTTTRGVSKLHSNWSSNNENKNSAPSAFNPFDYRNTSEKASTNYSRNQFSLRKARMQEIVSQLLDSSNQPEVMKTILQQNKDFLLEPLEDDQAVLEPDSIYRAGMDKNERYQTYEASMKERIEKARNSATKTVLTALMDYVISFKE